MHDTRAMLDPPSGRFLLRLPPALHGTLRDAAGRAGLSLNEYCVRALATPAMDPTGPGAAVSARALSQFGHELIGVLLYGSWARGDDTPASDIDALVVLDAARPITRALYREWDDSPLEHDGRAIEVHFVGLPPDDGEPGTVWLEAALDGVVAFDPHVRIARALGRVRREIAAGTRMRRRAHGQPYWTAAP
jgi:hypothetical protein